MDRISERLLHQIEGVDEYADAGEPASLELREMGEPQADRFVGIQLRQRIAHHRGRRIRAQHDRFAVEAMHPHIFRDLPDNLEQSAENVRVHRFDRESIMLGADSAASMMRYSLTELDSNKPISLRLAHFAQFKTGRLVSIRVLFDTFDLVEQALGHPINLPKLAS